MKTLIKTEAKIKILLVEDNPSDVRLSSLALKSSDFPYELRIISDGEAALDYLKQSGPYAEAPRPDIIFLDLNLPRMNGVEILLELRKDPALRNLPVVVLSGSNLPENIQEAYDAGADLYLTKPMNLDQFSFLFQYVSQIFKGRKSSGHDTPPPESPSVD